MPFLAIFINFGSFLFQIVSEKATSGSWTPRDVVVSVFSINSVILTMLKEVLKIRQTKRDEFSNEKYEFLPWTASPGPHGLRTLLMRQFFLTLNKVVPLGE